MARQKAPPEDHAAAATTDTPADTALPTEIALSRGERRHAKRAVVEGRVALAHALVALPEESLPALDLDEELLGELLLARRLKRSGAKKRQIRYVAKLIADDAEHLRAVLDGLADGSVIVDTPARRWIRRLRAEGGAAIQDLLDACPFADRSRLHRLMRQGDDTRLEAYLVELGAP